MYQISKLLVWTKGPFIKYQLLMTLAQNVSTYELLDWGLNILVSRIEDPNEKLTDQGLRILIVAD